MKILISDLDGTLVFRKDGKPYVSEEDLEAIKRFQKAGNLFGSCTGRGIYFACHGCEQVPFDFIIANSGATLKFGDKAITHGLPMELVKEVVDIYGHDQQYIFTTPDYAYVFNPDHEWPWETLDDMARLPDMLEGMSVEYSGDVEKCSRMVKLLEEKMSGKIGFQQNADSIDIVAYGHSKGTGVREVMEHYGVSIDDIHVIGDNYNDLPMLEASPNSYTVPHAPKEVQEKAAYIVSSVAECIDMIMKVS